MTKRELSEHLTSIAGQNDGVLRPEDVVAVARDPAHPLHDRFTWDDATAAEAHRLDQARALIRSVKVVIRTTTRTIKAVLYSRDPRAEGGEQGYVSAPRLRSELDIARDAISMEFARVEAALERARNQAVAVGLPDEARLAERMIAMLHEERAPAGVEAAA